VRIVAGRWGGRRLSTPRGAAVRPTADRVREALFSILGDVVQDARVLDLFAGSGALGLEALSRGAKFALFIEDDAGARAAIRRNVEALGLTGASKIWRRDATKLGEAGTLAPFELVFCDPPYGQGLGERALVAAAEGGWIVPGGIAVLEERADVEVAWPDAFSEIDRRRYGDTQIAIARFGEA
jgi:16S rRNA (guanine966-N2)-methyltransferase